MNHSHIGDNELKPSRGVFCEYLLELVHLIEKSRWVHVEYIQHHIDRSLYEPKCDLEAHYTWPAFINIASKNATSEAHYTWSAFTNIASKNVTSEAHYAWPAFTNIASKTWLWKLITHGQPSQILPQKCDFGSSLHMASLHKYCLKNVTSEAHYTWPSPHILDLVSLINSVQLSTSSSWPLN